MIKIRKKESVENRKCEASGNLMTLENKFIPFTLVLEKIYLHIYAATIHTALIITISIFYRTTCDKFSFLGINVFFVISGYSLSNKNTERRQMESSKPRDMYNPFSI